MGVAARQAEGLRLSVDYYDIQLDKAITNLNGANIANLCISGVRSFCDLFTFNAAGDPIALDAGSINLGSFQQNGYDVQLEPWEILQIGGRAGRFGHYERGHVGALDRRDARRVAQVFSADYEPPHREIATKVRPGADHIAVIAEGLHTRRLGRALSAFQRGMTFDSELLSPGVQDDMIVLADLADRHPKIPLAVCELVDWLLQKEPRDRPQSAAEVLAATPC